MPTDAITYQNSGYFSKLITDYLDEKEVVKQLYNRFPNLENFRFQIDEKSQNYPLENGAILVEELKEQYKNFHVSQNTASNIDLLQHNNTFTITTGHQLNLFTGPVYFIYKIISVINLCKQLKNRYQDYNFIPVFWLASEDHDFEEVNHFFFKNKKIEFNKETRGAVGNISTNEMLNVFEEFSQEIGVSENATFLKNLFHKAYLHHSNFTDATRYLANELFKEQGLVIIDGNSSKLKKLFTPCIKKELTEQITFTNVTKTIQQTKYTAQVNPREINLFYLEKNLRERIIFDGKNYEVINTNYTFTPTEILNLAENSPEKFSPNVLLRPLYQETILPNLCYIGGGAEVAYWLQLKATFSAFGITYPMVLLRNSVVIVNEKQIKKMQKLSLSWIDLFKKQEQLLSDKTKEFSEFEIDFSAQKHNLQQQFEKLYEIAIKTDKSFIGAVKAQEKKQIKGLENLEKRLLKAEKRNHQDKLHRIIALQNELFPNETLQERKANFSESYLENSALVSKIIEQLNPLDHKFCIITL